MIVSIKVTDFKQDSGIFGKSKPYLTLTYYGTDQEFETATVEEGRGVDISQDVKHRGWDEGLDYVVTKKMYAKVRSIDMDRKQAIVNVMYGFKDEDFLVREGQEIKFRLIPDFEFKPLREVV